MKNLFLIVLFSLIPLNAWCAKETVLVRVSDFPPYYFEDGSGNWKGVSIDIVKAVVKQAGYQIVFKKLPRSRAMALIKIGKIDLMLNLTQTKKREEFLDFIGLSSYEQMVLVVNEENKDINIKSLDDLRKFDKKFGLQRDYFYPNLSEKLKADKEFEKHFDYIEKTELNIRKTLGARIIGFFEDRMFAIYSVKTNPEYKGLVVHPFSLNEPQPVHIAASLKISQEKRDRLRTAHQQLTKSGKIQAILDEWMK